jgi:hypothetical protein
MKPEAQMTASRAPAGGGAVATIDFFEPWIDLLVTDPFSESPRTARAADVAATSTADVRRDGSEVRPELELVHVRAARREPLRALELPIPERPEVEGLRRGRRKPCTPPVWLDRESDDRTTH